MENNERERLVDDDEKRDFFDGNTMETNELPSDKIVVNRPTHTEVQFAKTYRKLNQDDNSSTTVLIRCQKHCAKTFVCSTSRWLSFLFGLFPILSWTRKYQKRWIVGDLVSGLTVGVVHIPQSLAFAILAGLPPVFGLYTSFYPVIIYALMGTSRHLSIGTFAVTSLMTQVVVNKFAPLPNIIETNVTANSLNSSIISSIGVPSITEVDVERVKIASALTFLMGLFQLIFGICRLGMISSYLSIPLIQAFTTGAALHVVTSQTPTILGLKVASFSGIAGFIRNWIEIFKNLPNAQGSTVLVSVVCIAILAAGREINLRYKQKMKMPIPTEIIVVIIAILASHFGQFESNFGIVIVKNVPTGFPAPVLPKMSILPNIIGDAFAIAVVAFAINVSLAKLFAMQKGYEIDSNQELVAYGVANVIPSFFLCFPSAAALARCAIQANTGGNTQLVSVISVVVVLIVILVLGPVFQPLPRPVLGSIIIVGLFGIITQLKHLKAFYKTSKVDFSIWVITFLSVILLGVDIGLLAGVVYSIATVIGRTQLPRCEVLVNVDGSDVYRPRGTCEKSFEVPGVIIFKFYSGLYYANKDMFKSKINGEIKKNDEVLVAEIDEENNKTLNLRSLPERGEVVPFSRVVIIDCSAISFIDHGGALIVKEIFNELKQKDIKFLLASCNDDMIEMLRRYEYMKLAGEDSVFITVHDAVVSIRMQQLKMKSFTSIM